MHVGKPARDGAGPGLATAGSLTALGPEGAEGSSYRSPEGAVAVGEGPSDKSDIQQQNTAPVTITVGQEGRRGKYPNLSLLSPAKVLSVPPIG